MQNSVMRHLRASSGCNWTEKLMAYTGYMGPTTLNASGTATGAGITQYMLERRIRVFFMVSVQVYTGWRIGYN